MKYMPEQTVIIKTVVAFFILIILLVIWQNRDYIQVTNETKGCKREGVMLSRECAPENVCIGQPANRIKCVEF